MMGMNGRIAALSVWMVIALLWLGCPPSSGDDDDLGDDDASGDDDDDDDDGGISIVATYPEDGASGPYYRDCLEVTFSEAVEAVTFALSGPGGAVDGDTGIDGAEAHFCPGEALACETAYTVDVTWDGGGAGGFGFSTDGLGCPVDGSPVGTTFAVDLTAVDIVEPDGVGPLIATFLDTLVLLQVDEVGGGEIQMLGAISDAEAAGTEQDLCLPTFSPTQGAPGLWDDPYFEFEADDLLFSFMGEHDISVERLVMSGSLTPDLSSFERGRFEAVLDVRSVATIPEVEDLFGDMAICDFLSETLAVDCVPCGDGEPQCVYFLAEEIAAPAVPGLTLVDRTAADVAGDPACAAD